MAGGALAAFVGSFFVAHLLSPGERGEYASILVFVTLAATLLEMGGGLGVIRGLTEDEVDETRFISGYLCWTLIASVFFGILAAAASVVFFPWLRPMWFLAPCGAAAIYSALVARLVAGLLLSSGKLRTLIMARTAANAGTIPGSLFFLLADRPSAVHLAALSFLCQAVLNSLFLIPFRCVRSCLKRFVSCSFPAHPLRDAHVVWRRSNVHLHLLNVATYAMLRSDQIALSLLGAGSTLGIYAVAANMSEVIGYVPVALLPLVARGRPDSPVHLRKIFLALGAGIALVTPAAFFAFPLVYGSEYRSGSYALLVLMPASGVLAVGRLIQGVELREPARRKSLAGIALVAGVIEFAAVLLLGGTSAVHTALACTTGYGVFTIWVALSRRKGDPGATTGIESNPPLPRKSAIPAA
ncbi:hypothetical protein ABZX90_04815 [Streptomyces sp. NPDC002935]|uniref:hypothetical protein n=1 Tax=unclassified Streptomyces TaxID=2593676 RepID=UPI003334A455